MKELKLSYGQKSFEEIKKYLEKNYNESYTLAIYDMLEEETAEIECSKDEILPAIMLVTDMEHSFPEWIGINELTDTVVVGMKFTRGHLQTNCSYKYKDRQFIRK